ncbi:MAG: hypothetical protein ACYCRH_10795 [Acidiferrobacteraceae bacterium]
MEQVLAPAVALVDLPLAAWGLRAKVVYTLLKLRFFNLIGIGGSSRLRPCHTTRHAGPHRAVREVEVM